MFGSIEGTDIAYRDPAQSLNTFILVSRPICFVDRYNAVSLHDNMLVTGRKLMDVRELVDMKAYPAYKLACLFNKIFLDLRFNHVEGFDKDSDIFVAIIFPLRFRGLVYPEPNSLCPALHEMLKCINLLCMDSPELFPCLSIFI